MKFIMYAIAVAVICAVTQFIIFPMLFDGDGHSFAKVMINIILLVAAIFSVEYMYKKNKVE